MRVSTTTLRPSDKFLVGEDKVLTVVKINRVGKAHRWSVICRDCDGNESVRWMNAAGSVIKL
jgi:hypothetical protein